MTRSTPPKGEEFLGSSPHHVFARDQEGRFARYRRTFLEELGRDDADLEKLQQESVSPPSPEAVRRMTQYDGETGIPNQMVFYDRLSLALAAARRERHRLAVLVIDALPGEARHVAGTENGKSRILKEIASLLKGAFRSSDTVATPGDGLFFMILPQVVRLEDTLVVARKILRVFGNDPLAAQLSDPWRIAVGIAVYPDHGENGRIIVEKAGYALREAELQGGNNFVVFGQDRRERPLPPGQG